MAAYERALFRAFTATDTVVLERIWNFDRTVKRARMPIPYASQEIYTARLGGRIIAAAAMNYDTKGPLQLEMMGFAIDKAPPDFCEGLALFNLQIFAGNTMVAVGLKDYAFDYVKKRGVRRIYGTCSEKRLRGYSLMGWKPVDTRKFERGDVYLICQEMPG